MNNHSLENKLKATMLLAAWAAIQPTKRGSGKKPRAPKQGNPVPELEAIDFLQHGLVSVLEANNAPAHWHPQIGFFVACLLFPQRVNGAELNNGVLTIRHDYEHGRHDDAIIYAANFGRLYSQNPAVFLRVLLDMGTELEKRLDSPETVVAIAHLINRKCYLVKAGDLAKRINSSRLPVTQKVVEHARQKLREHSESLSPAQR